MCVNFVLEHCKYYVNNVIGWQLVCVLLTFINKLTDVKDFPRYLSQKITASWLTYASYIQTPTCKGSRRVLENLLTFFFFFLNTVNTFGERKGKVSENQRKYTVIGGNVTIYTKPHHILIQFINRWFMPNSCKICLCFTNNLDQNFIVYSLYLNDSSVLNKSKRT